MSSSSDVTAAIPDLVDLPLSDGGACEAYLARPPGDGDHPGVLFLMDAIGLRPQIAAMADMIAGWGYVVLAPNLFHRSGTAAETAPREDLRRPGAREAFFATVGPRMEALTPARVESDLADYLSFLTGSDGVSTPLGVTGYCLGARLALRAAILHPDLIAACGGFHGGRLVTDAPDSPHLGMDAARAEMVFGHADQDASMPPAQVDALGEAFLAAGLTAINQIVPGAPHGYTMADTAMYDEAGDRWHQEKLRALLERRLG